MAKNQEETKSVGRPEIPYKAEYCETVKKMSKEGKLVGEICLALGISDDTYYRWQTHHPDFGRAVKDAEKLREQHWKNLGVENIENKNFNAKIYNLMMMNICGWNRKTEANHNVTVKTHEEMLREMAKKDVK